MAGVRCRKGDRERSHCKDGPKRPRELDTDQYSRFVRVGRAQIEAVCEGVHREDGLGTRRK